MFFLEKNKYRYFSSILLLLIAMISIQSGASIAKSLFPIIGPLGVTTLRLSLSAIMLTVIFKPWKKQLFLQNYKNLIIYGISLGLMNLFFYLSIQRIPLGITVALEFLGPLTVAILSSKRAMDIIWIIIIVVGLIFLLPFENNINNLDIIGILYALFAGLFWGMYIIFGQKSSELYGTSAVSIGLFISTLIFLPTGLFKIGTNLFDISILPIAFIVSILSTAIPYTIEMYVLTQIPKKTFSTLMSLEPVIGAFIGTMFLNENLILKQWIALFCIISASICSISTSKKNI